VQNRAVRLGNLANLARYSHELAVVYMTGVVLHSLRNFLLTTGRKNVKLLARDSRDKGGRTQRFDSFTRH
jgi:hypothetical protein